MADHEVARWFLECPDATKQAYLTDLTEDDAAALTADVNALVQEDLDYWCRLALSAKREVPAAHHKLLIRELTDIATGANTRLAVELPPGSAKSTYVSDLFPPWFMRRQHGLCLIGTSHTADLAKYFSRRAMNRIVEYGDALGIGLRTEAAESWFATNGAEYKAAGVGGAITGRRADLGIIDDPIKGREQADQPTERQKMWEWYQNDFLTRLKPDGRIVLCMTRWHEDDLFGRILEAEPGRWRTLCIRMECEDADDPLERDIGERLWPEYFTEEQVAVAKVDPRKWTSLYQQRPSPAQGALFQVGKLVLHDDTPPLAKIVRAWDLAATEAGAVHGGRRKTRTDPDWTAGVKLGRTANGRYVVLDVVRVRGGPEVVERTIQQTAEDDGRSVAIGLPQDPGQAGKAQVSYLGTGLAGYTIVASLESGSKTTRAGPVASQCNLGNLGMLKAPWNAWFADELRSFPAGKWDDQVDALSRAFTMVMVKARGTERRRVQHMAR